MRPCTAAPDGLTRTSEAAIPVGARIDWDGWHCDGLLSGGDALKSEIRLKVGRGPQTGWRLSRS
jgi:hypothetical protein